MNYFYPTDLMMNGQYFWTKKSQTKQDDSQNEQIQNLRIENQELKAKITELEQRIDQIELELQNFNEKPSQFLKLPKNRRVRNNDIQKTHSCPYDSCFRSYGSVLALNLHIKQKHNGSSKSQRETFAKILMECEEKGQDPPAINCNFPPGFLEEFKQKYFSSQSQRNNLKKPKQKQSRYEKQ